MSFDPNNPQRPRSTPIPDGSGSSLPPPTPAQFLNDQPQQVPWTPQPGRDVNAQMGFSAAPGFGTPGGSSSGRVVWLIVIIILATTAGVGWLIYKQVDDAVDDANDRVSDQPFSTFDITIPSFSLPTFSIPTFSIPSIPEILPPETVVPATIGPADAVTTVPAAISTVPIATVAEETTTLPTPPPTVLPTPPPTTTILPNGGTSVFGEGAARVVADALDLGMAGEPTQFTQILLFADNAVATAQDPANPSQIIGAQWVGGRVDPLQVESTGGDGDLSSELFTGGEVNWEAITGLVALAPAYLNLPDGQVTNVSIDRVGTPPTVKIILTVEGPSGSGYVEASASGDILTSGPL